MSVPLDRLYNFLHDLCNSDILIYRYLPHGSRKISDCRLLMPTEFTSVEKFNKMYVFCHDQELLNLACFPKVHMAEIPNVPFNVYRVFTANMINQYDRVIVVHSELNSYEVDWFKHTGAVPVYWWSHAIIAQDWFRYANIDPALEHHKSPQQDFLIYNRAWQGLREYRLKFAELILENNLISNCRMGFNPVDDTHYSQHQFINPEFKISNFDLDAHFPLNTTSSSASADYCSRDYAETGIEVVLETLFDDQRWHLTEKALRPIACGQPFIIAGTQGILKYLRSYGFKTFSPLIDESYDDLQDPLERMKAIITVMQNISNMPAADKAVLYQQMRQICIFNKERFFSDDFSNYVVSEFKQNFDAGVVEMQKHQTGAYFKLFLQKMKHQLDRMPVSRQEIVKLWQRLHSINC